MKKPHSESEPPAQTRSGVPESPPSQQQVSAAQNTHHKIWGSVDVEESSNSYSETMSESTSNENSSNAPSAAINPSRSGVLPGSGSRKRSNVKQLFRLGVDPNDVQLLTSSASNEPKSESNEDGFAEPTPEAAQNSARNAMAPPGVWSTTQDAPNLYDPNLEQMSPGSLKHAEGMCKPCAWYWTRGCSNGRGCSFCHLCEDGTIKVRRKERLWRLAAERKAALQGRGNDNEGSDSTRPSGRQGSASSTTKVRL